MSAGSWQASATTAARSASGISRGRRLRYGGSARSFGVAYYSRAAGRYEDSALITGSPAGTPQEALDTVATFHVSDTATNPR